MGTAAFDAGGWKYSPWFHYYFDTYSPLILHESLGWLYAVGTSSDALWLYDYTGRSWLFTNEHLYPGLYRYASNEWLIYVPGTAKPRWFYRFGHGWVSDDHWSE